MDALRKEATVLRERISRQQQAISEHFGIGVEGPESVEVETELQQHQNLEKLYISTRAGKHFQRDIVRCVEGYNVVGSKQVELSIKLSENSRKYAGENTERSPDLSKVALELSNALAKTDKEHVDLLAALSSQVSEPLRAMVLGGSLDNARLLAQRYDNTRQEVEAQAIEVSKFEAEVMEFEGNSEYVVKLEAAEWKLEKLKSSMAALCREATAVMAAVEAQQHTVTLQRLRTMVEAKRKYHHKISQIFKQLEAEMGSEQTEDLC